MKDEVQKKDNPSKVDRFIDGFIRALKIAGGSDLFLGIFVVIEGFSLIFVPALFPACIALSIIIAFTFAIEWFFDIIRHRRTVWSVLQQICIVLILIALIVYCFLMIFDDLFRLNIDRVLVSATTIGDGLKNLIHAVKVEKRIIPRIICILLSLVYINYGIIYCFLGGEVNFFTTIMHGVVFIFCGLTNVWLYYRDPKNKDSIKKPSEYRKK